MEVWAMCAAGHYVRCMRESEGKGRRPVGLESRELLLPRDPSPVSFFLYIYGG